jgi:NAD(P)H-flavin reductase
MLGLILQLINAKFYSLSMQNTSALDNVQQASNIEQDILICGVPVMFRHTYNKLRNGTDSIFLIPSCSYKENSKYVM